MEQREILTILVKAEFTMANWAVADAKAKFSAVLDLAESEGPQLVERRKRRFVLMTEEELTRRTQAAAKTSAPSKGETSGMRLWDALRCPPVDGVNVELPRLKWKPRKVEF